jgi:hypothetical protein
MEALYEKARASLRAGDIHARADILLALTLGRHVQSSHLSSMLLDYYDFLVQQGDLRGAAGLLVTMYDSLSLLFCGSRSQKERK